MPEVSEEVVPEEGTPDAAPTEAIAMPEEPDSAEEAESAPNAAVDEVGEPIADPTPPAPSVVETSASEAVEPETAEPEAAAPAATTVPEAVASEAVVPEAVVPEAAEPEATVPEAVVPEAAAPAATTVPEAVASEAAVPEAAEPEATVPEAVVPEAAEPEATVPEAVVPEAAAPAATTVPEAVASEAVVPEPVPEAAVPEAVASEAVASEAVASEAVASEAVEPEAAVPEAAVPEAAVPEAAVPEAAVPEAVEPEAAVPAAGLPADPKIGATASPDVAVPEPIRPPSDSGKIVGGLITAISSDEVCLTIDDGREAVINGRNFDEHNTDPTTVYNVGDRIEGAILTREDPKKRVVLSRSWALKKTAWERVATAAAANELLTGKVTATSKRGVVVDVGVRGFVPSSHIALEHVSNMSTFVGQTLEFKVLEVDMAKERLVLSRRSILLKEQRKGVHDLLTGLEVGAKCSGVVSSLTDYGAFVDLGGVNGLVHLSEMSWQRVDRPADALAVGQEVEVKVLDVKVKKRRVSLSIRQLTSDPLAAVVVDSLIEGPVTRLVDFGAFVDLGGVEGLVHLSELAEYRVSTPEEIVFPGEIIRAKVLSVDKKRRRIELSIRQAVSGDFG